MIRVAAKQYKNIFLTVLAASFVISGFLIPHIATAASGGFIIAGTGTDGNGSGVPWTSPENITVSSGGVTVASVSVDNANPSHNLQATNFGFSIPVDATINGIEVRVFRSSDTGAVQDYVVRLIKGGIVDGDNKSSLDSWPVFLDAKIYGSNLDSWGIAWTPDDINNSNFGVALAVVGTTPASATAFVDSVEVSVSYIENVQFPQLIVQKVVINHLNNRLNTDFNLFVSDGLSPVQVVSNAMNYFNPGSYVISEVGPSGYTATFSGDCDLNGNITLVAGQNPKICTITNEDNQTQTPPDINNLGATYTGCTGIQAVGQALFYWNYSSGVSQKNFYFQVAQESDPNFQNPPFLVDRAIDGSATQQSVFVYQGSQPDALVYNSSYHWRVKACDLGDVCSDWAPAGLYVQTSHPAPFTSFDFSPPTPIASQEISFINNSICYDTNGQAACTSHVWDFGDSQLSYIANPTHTYGSESNYNVQLQVGDDSEYCSQMQTIPVGPSIGSNGTIWKEVSPF